MKLVDTLFPRHDSIAELSSLTLREETDVRGWSTGFVLDAQRHQGTVNLALEEPGYVPEQTWRTFENGVAQLDRMVCTCTIDEAGQGAQPARTATTFRATSKEQMKNLNHLVTDISLRQQELYECADELSLPLRPLDSAGLMSTVLGSIGLEGSRWESLEEMDMEVSSDNIIVSPGEYNELQMACFTVETSDPLVSDFVDSMMADWDGEEVLRRTRVFRPYVLPEGTGEDLATGSGRRWAIITTSGSDAADWAFTQVLNEDPTVAIRARRLRGRQRTALLAGLGIGVLGWQHIGAADRQLVQAAKREVA